MPPRWVTADTVERPRPGGGSGPQVVLVDQAVEGLAVDAGGLGRRGDVAVVSCQQVAEIRELEHLQPLLLGRLEREIGPGAELGRLPDPGSAGLRAGRTR